MKISIRTKFTSGIIFLFIIIAVLSIFSALQLNRLSKKTSLILKENHYSVVYAREMSNALTNINQEITHGFLVNKYPDSILIKKELTIFDKSLQLEKNNITEVGEDKLASTIELGYKEYCDSATTFMKMSESADRILFLQKKSTILNQQLMLLSQMNEKAIELKTTDAKTSTKKALLHMTILATLCFLIAFSFAVSFASYFNERFFQLHNGIKEIVSSNYGQRLHFNGKDEFYEIALAFNKMAEKLNDNMQNKQATINEENEKEINLQGAQELKEILMRMKKIEEEASELIIKLTIPLNDKLQSNKSQIII